MEHTAFRDLSISLHEYPDPDAAASTTQYPWVGDNYESITAIGRKKSSVRSHDFQNHRMLLPSSGNEHDAGTDVREVPQDPGVDVDPDYLSSGDADSDDENLSEDNIEETTEAPLSRPAAPALTPMHMQQLLSLSSTYGGKGACMTNSVMRTKGRRSTGLGRGGKGLKRGLRRPLEPNLGFKAQLSEATIAFTKSEFEKAEIFALKALQLNPEMYQAHSLLSEIHAARGDKERALAAAWNGAHTRPRDTQVWTRIAGLILERNTENREAILRDAVYCYTRIISVEKDNIEARYQRAALNRELGYKKKVAADYEHLLKCLPHDTSILRNLAEIYLELKNADRALQYYQNTIARSQADEPNMVTGFTWSDVNIVAELYGFLGRYQDGIVEIKSLSRWLLGRKAEHYWNNFDEDDREWDRADHPRRNEVSEFVRGAYEPGSYGDDLPLELRIKLGVFRLSTAVPNLSEAMAHFEWLDPEDYGTNAKLFDYPDLYREAANALKRQGYIDEALRYFEPLQHAPDFVDTPVIVETALCYRAVGLLTEAENCYNTILEINPGSTEARIALWNMAKDAERARPASSDVTRIASTTKQKSRKRLDAKIIRKPRELDSRQNSSPGLFQQRQFPRLIKKTETTKVSEQEAELQALYARWKTLDHECCNDAGKNKAWFEAARLLLQTFKDNKVFYPAEKNIKFYGYSKEARALANRRKYERESFILSSDSVLTTPDGDEIIIPDQYLGTPFTCWLGIFLKNSLELAKCGDISAAYENIGSALGANVFYHSPDALLAIYICWLTCALLANDEEALCSIARWFMTEYQFVTDGYRLFSALNRLCDTTNAWYNCGPSQKFVLRQLKAMDFSFVGEDRKKSLFQERASYTTKDTKGNPIEAEDLDVAVLMLYGHILFAGKSYAYSVNYFLRALALDPENTIVKLSIALGYIHWSLKRQAENRHHILLQGFAFLMEYYTDCQRDQDWFQMQEAEYNVGRAHHMLGLTHLAIPHYERCLELGQKIKHSCSLESVENFGEEAAFALQGLWSASRDMGRAKQVTEGWLVL